MEQKLFGTTAKGENVYRVTIQGGGLTANILNWGAVIQDLRLEGHDKPLVIGFKDFDDYVNYSSYFGATPGRCANRIAKGKFELDGKTYQLERNENGTTHLHGGSDGLGTRIWNIVETTEDSVTLEITDPDGRAGYPGNCLVRATYALKADGVLSVAYTSTVDQPCPVNICQHSYFNIGNGSDTLDHEIMIAADHYLPTDEDQIPTGEIKPVDSTPFDLRQMKSMKLMDQGKQVLFDHNFCLSDARVAKRKVAEVRCAESGLAMDVLTTEPGVQYYAAFKLAGKPPGLDGRVIGPFGGFCLETQVWPDAINHANFPNAVLRPGETLVQDTDYVFRHI